MKTPIHTVSYLASPYNHEDKSIMQDRVMAVLCAAAALLERGVYVFSPIAHNTAIIHAAEMKTGWAKWSEFDKAMLSRCDSLIVLMLDGWEASAGVQGEIEFARQLGIPIKFMDARTGEIIQILGETGVVFVDPKLSTVVLDQARRIVDDSPHDLTLRTWPFDAGVEPIETGSE